MLNIPGISKVSIHKYNDSTSIPAQDQVAEESPLEIRIKHYDGKGWQKMPLAVTMRTPVQDYDLVRGFLFTEAIIRSAQEISSIRDVTENIIEVTLDIAVKIDHDLLKRNFYTSSSCGVCGKASIDSVQTENVYLPWSSSLQVNADILLHLSHKLSSQQSLFSLTGGIHATALFDEEGTLKLLREDVGRHNAMDKLIGALLAENKLPVAGIVMVSGRVSFELVQKATMAGIPMLVAVGAPSSLAVELAQAQGMTLIGFLRDQRFNIYSCPERIVN